MFRRYPLIGRTKNIIAHSPVYWGISSMIFISPPSSEPGLVEQPDPSPKGYLTSVCLRRSWESLPVSEALDDSSYHEAFGAKALNNTTFAPQTSKWSPCLSLHCRGFALPSPRQAQGYCDCTPCRSASVLSCFSSVSSPMLAKTTSPQYPQH
jgi:hypothetical protein